MNITTEEEKAMRELLYDTSIVIRPSDKSSGVVIMNTEDYKLEVEKELNNNDTYKAIDKDVTQKYENKVKKLVENLCKREIIDKDMKKYLLPKGTCPGKVQANPKLHKKIIRNLHPFSYWRYVDDIWGIWEHGLDELKQFHELSNNLHPGIKTEMRYSTEKIEFLDVFVNIENGQLKTDLFTKSTDKHQYLHVSSSHPNSVKKCYTIWTRYSCQKNLLNRRKLQNKKRRNKNAPEKTWIQ
ncbi:unnamed protein product [Mytilus coruscus]|uniref:Reverse transcriptase domain-containing protein n=1 Tax=Mytilus coruscus TaxID=42192 RepID=A0A6J8DKD1_MYTCO|nr:unnamed protein product [Mytilus coruscus]